MNIKYGGGVASDILQPKLTWHGHRKVKSSDALVCKTYWHWHSFAILQRSSDISNFLLDHMIMIWQFFKH